MGKHDFSEGKGDYEIDILSDKESEDLFKIAFRNYLNLVGLADKKAGLLIQVNSILAPIVGYTITLLDRGSLYRLPIALVLAGAAITILFGILASKPVTKTWNDGISNGKQEFFFGSFDRLDPNFKHVTWERYSSDMTSFFKGDKRYVLEELIKESYQVRKVLAKKFGYLTIAYKVFFLGLLTGILSFLAIIAIQH